MMSVRKVFYSIQSHLCLHHQRPMHTQVVHNPVNVHSVLILDLIDESVDGNEGACPANPSTRETGNEQMVEGHFP